MPRFEIVVVVAVVVVVAAVAAVAVVFAVAAVSSLLVAVSGTKLLDRIVAVALTPRTLAL